MKTIFSAFFILVCISIGFSQTQYLVIGTYDSPKSEGIYVYEFNTKDGTAKEISHVQTSNPSYIAISPDKRYLYAVNENADKNGKGGSVSSFSFDKKAGVLTRINTQSSEGNHPCYITVDQTGRWIITGNYSSGNFSILPVNNMGELKQAIETVQLTGKGLDSTRQNSPHVHSTFLNKKNNVLYVADLGIDKILNYSFDEKNGTVQPLLQKSISTEAGAGPRHMDISSNGKFLYLVQELSGMVTVFSTKNSVLKHQQTISSLPQNFKGKPASADIHLSSDGNFLYVSNRGESNSLAIFKINKKDGRMNLLQHQSTLGLGPRNFNFDPSGKYLLVANQNSNEVVIFERNINSGLLKDTGKRISVGKPVCIKWM